MFSVCFLASLVPFKKYAACKKALEVKKGLGFLGSKVKGEVEDMFQNLHETGAV